MSIRKLISKALVVSVLFNIGTPSFASGLSPDTRYETFEGSDIVVEDVMQQEDVDVEIEGNTIVNLVDFKDKIINYDEAIDYQEISIKENQIYTVVIDIAENSLENGLWFSAWEFSGNLRHLPCSVDNPYCFMDNSEVKADFMVAASGQTGRFILKIGIANKNPNTKNRFVLFSSASTQGKCVASAMLLEGDLNEEEIPDEYFEGIKSVGQDDENGNSIEVLSSNINLFDINKDVNQKYPGMITGDINIYSNKVLDDGGIESGLYSYYHHGRGQIIKLKKNTNYRIKARVVNHGHIIIRTKKNTSIKEIYAKDSVVNQVFNTGNEDEVCLSFITFGTGNYPNAVFYNLQLTLDTYDKEHVTHQSDVLQIPLLEPLRALPNGIKDRVIKRDGQWVIERNCAELILKDYMFDRIHIYDTNVHRVVLNIEYFKNIKKGDWESSLKPQAVFESASWSEFRDSTDDYWTWFHSQNQTFHIICPIGTTLEEAIERYSDTRVVYQLENPIYEPLNADSVVNLYLDTTQIFNNSNIPANMKVTVDRVLNRAVEAVELAKADSTTENISLARMWTNLIDESSIKDQLQDEVTSITEIKDKELERKTVTSNMDLYVKSDNMLSMTLSTNSISFDNYSGVDNMEKLKALEISINSSLPYSLNSYLVTEIQNSDGSSKIDREHFNIRESSQGEYKKFLNVGEKLILKDSCEAGNNVMHNIDMKLNGSDAHKADIYKTVIKFEAEQK